MRKIALVARWEYLFNVRRKSFLFAAFGIPVFLVVIMLVIFALQDSTEGTLEAVGPVGYVDQASVLAGAVAKPDPFVAHTSEETARQALDDGTLGAYFVVPDNYMQVGIVQLYSYTTSADALKDAIDDFLRANLIAELPESIPLERLKDPADLTVHVQDTGRVMEEDGIFGLFITPFIFSIVFMMASQITGGFLMNGVVEEKVNRIMEVLVTSITPMQLLVGKLLGLAALGLTQLVVWGIVTAIVSRFTDQIPFLSGVVIPPDLAVVGVIYFFLSYFLLASMLAGIGAVSNSEEESRQYSGIFALLVAIPFFFITTFLDDPNGAAPVILSLIPFTAALAMILRISLGVVPLAHIVLSVGVTLLSTLFIIWLSARVFRWGLLLYGKRITPREIWRVIRQAPEPHTVAARSQEV